MAGYRIWLTCGAAIFAALAIVPSTRAQLAQPPQAMSCKVYSFADLGDDPKLGKWIAETIPEMIQPASWKQSDAKLAFYAPSKLLVVNHTAAVHAQVEEFLAGLRKSMPQTKTVRHDSEVKPAQFLLQDTSRPGSGVQSGPTSYPVPMAPVGPKHLFHFIIRYEGEGIIDSNVAKFAKSLVEGNKWDSGVVAQSNYVFPPSSGPVCMPAAMPVMPTTNPPRQMPLADAPMLVPPAAIPVPPAPPLSSVP